MKVVFLMVLGLLLFASCSSAPQWENMSEKDISTWKELNVNIESANYLIQNKISPEVYSVWKGNGVTKPEVVVAWSQQKFSAKEAAEWVKAGFSLEDSKEYRSKGLQPVQ
ncbi:MAG: hypothetical protein MK132_05125 [Lentisphaerales bacterium]|nr:hypothetical protein [Lentisphaerales bacterium]